MPLKTMPVTPPVSALVILVWLSCRALAQELHFSVAEESSPSLLGNVAVLANLTSVLSQRDLGSLQYAIVDDNGDSPFFVDQRSGDLSTRTILDREALCGTAEVCVVRGAVAVQSSSPTSAFFRKFTVVLKIMDINDHPPVFSQSSFVVNIPENAGTDTAYVLPSATDQDVDPHNRVQRYALDPSFEEFQLHVVRSTDALGDEQFVVNLKVVRPLDRENRQLFITSLVAIDGGNPPRRASLPLSIDVVDRNDNAPQFEKLEYSKTLKEDTRKDSTVLMVAARDADEGDNARVSYFISDSADSEIKSLFAVSQDMGIITVKQALVNRGGKTFTFEVVAQDNGVPVKKSVCRVAMTVLDTMNDRPVMEVSPLFSVRGAAVVPETAAVGRVVSLLTVLDNDSGRNGMVTCTLDSGFFQLQRLMLNEYKVIVAAPLDREKMSNYTLLLRCMDNGHPPLSTESVLHVQVTDSNDNSPAFGSSNYILSVAENQVVGTWVGQVQAQDLDEGENARLVYDMENNGDIFTIDSMLGDIYTTRVLDREAIPQYVFMVFTHDQSDSPLTASATVTVNVADKNDMRPVFTAPSYTFHLQEHAPPGTLVGQVKATDGDIGPNGRLEYMMVTQQPRPSIPIGVNSSGAVLVTSIVDYETLNVYSFSVSVMDMGSPRHNATCRVTVEVLDNNDHHPVITFPSPNNPSVTIPVDTAPGSEIAKVVAYDMDTGANGNLRYTISVANATTLFHIDENTGVITLGNQILSGDVRSYNIVVTVTDNGVPQMAQRALLQIEVTSADEAGSRGGGSSGSSTSMKLVIVLVCLTLLLAVAVLTPLLFLYCFNRRRPAHEKHRHKILTRPGYQPERLEKKAGDRITSVFTSQRDDTAIYSSTQMESKFRSESDSGGLNPDWGFAPDRDSGSIKSFDDHQPIKEIDYENSPDLVPKIAGGLHRDGGDMGNYNTNDSSNSNSSNGPKWDVTSLRENLAALHCPKKVDMSSYSCEGGSNPRYQSLDRGRPNREGSKKRVNFEDERHPSIMEEVGGGRGGDVGGSGLSSPSCHEMRPMVVTHGSPVQAVQEDLPSPGQFSTFKPPHKAAGPYEDHHLQTSGGRQGREQSADPVHMALRQHNVLLKALRNTRPSPQQQRADGQRNKDMEEWSSSSADTTDSGHGGSEVDVAAMKISV